MEGEEVEVGEGGEVKLDKEGWQYSDFPYGKCWEGSGGKLKTSMRRKWVARLVPEGREEE